MMLFIRQVLCVTALLFSNPVVAKKSGFPVKVAIPKYQTTASDRSVLSVRGGAGPIDPDAFAKVVACINAAQGVTMQLAPKETSAMFGISTKDFTPLLQYTFEMLGSGIIAFAILPIAMLFFGASFKTAYIVSNLVLVYNALEFALTDRLTSVGFASKAGAWATLVVRLLPVIAILKDMDIADKLISASIWFWGLAGLQQLFAPAAAAKAWGLTTPHTPISEDFSRAIGCTLVGASLFQGSIVFYDRSVAQAAGLCMLGPVYYHLRGILSGHYKKYGVDAVQMGAWAVLNFLLFVTTNF